MKQEMLHQIATNGSVSLEELPSARKNKVALNTANTILLGAALESDLINSNGLLPRTLDKQYQSAKGLKRKEGNSNE